MVERLQGIQAIMLLDLIGTIDILHSLYTPLGMLIKKNPFACLHKHQTRPMEHLKTVLGIRGLAEERVLELSRDRFMRVFTNPRPYFYHLRAPFFLRLLAFTHLFPSDFLAFASIPV